VRQPPQHQTRIPTTTSQLVLHKANDPPPNHSNTTTSLPHILHHRPIYPSRFDYHHSPLPPTPLPNLTPHPPTPPLRDDDDADVAHNYNIRIDLTPYPLQTPTKPAPSHPTTLSPHDADDNDDELQHYRHAQNNVDHYTKNVLSPPQMNPAVIHLPQLPTMAFAYGQITSIHFLFLTA
jgi:hypothetical protein